MARGSKLDANLTVVALEHGIPVLGTSQVTMNFLNAATIRLEDTYTNRFVEQALRTVTR